MLISIVVGDTCSKLLNRVWPEAVDERALNRVPDAETKLARSQALENNTLFLKAAGSLGCSIPSVTPEDLTDGKVRGVPPSALPLLHFSTSPRPCSLFNMLVDNGGRR